MNNPITNMRLDSLESNTKALERKNNELKKTIESLQKQVRQQQAMIDKLLTKQGIDVESLHLEVH